MLRVDRWALVVAVGIGAACAALDPFVCDTNEDCDRNGIVGTCLNDHACGYPDDTCPSGLRRSPNAERGAGECAAGPSADGGTTTDNATTTGMPSCGLRKTITIDSTLISPSTSLDGYPLLVSFTDGDLIAAVDTELFFTDDAGVHLPHELETFDAATGRLEAWVRLPGWVPGQPLAVDLNYEAADMTPETNATDVWGETFRGVWHLPAQLRGGDGEVVRDSTRNGEHGFTQGGISPEQVVPGAIGAALAFDGDDDVIDIPASFVNQLESLTISVWARADGDGINPSPFFSRVHGESLYPRCRKLPDNGNILCQQRVGGAEEHVTVSAASSLAELGELVLIALTWDAVAGRMELFVDGEPRVSSTGTNGPPNGGDRSVHLGRIDEFGSIEGILDEFRVADSVLPADWLAADFRTQSLPANVLLAVGPAEPRCP